MNQLLQFAFLMVTLTASVWAQQQPAGPAEPKPVSPPGIREIAPGIYQVGGVKLEREARRISFPVKLNMTNGPIEYLLVTAAGKTHESLLTTDIEPQHLQVAMLLLGAKGMQAAPLTNAPAGGPITQALGGRNPPLPGDSVLVEVSWKKGGQSERKRIEALVFNKRANEPMSAGPFTFTGSRLWQGKFVAQTDGSLISIITDPDAVFNNPRPNRDADDTWVVHGPSVPNADTGLELNITMPPIAKSPAGQGK